MRRKFHIAYLVVAIVVLPFAGYALMQLVSTAMPMSETTLVSHVAFTLIILVLGLATPYAMFKLLAHAAHIRNPQEPDLRLRDLPKDKDQLTRRYSSR